MLSGNQPALKIILLVIVIWHYITSLDLNGSLSWLIEVWWCHIELIVSWTKCLPYKKHYSKLYLITTSYSQYNQWNSIKGTLENPNYNHNKSALVWVMVQCCYARNYYLNQWLSRSMSNFQVALRASRYCKFCFSKQFFVAPSNQGMELLIPAMGYQM